MTGQITLYKKNGKKIQQWTVQWDDGKHRTIEGFVDGTMTTNEWTVCTPKHVGKKNEVKVDEQAYLEARAKAQLKRDKGYVDDPSGEGEERFEPMLAHKYEDNLKRIEPYIDGSCDDYIYSQPKLDGMRCNIMMVDDGNVVALSRQGKPIVSIPHILRELTPFFEDYPDIILDGELYNHNLKDDFNSIISHTRKSKPTSDDLAECAKVIEYHIYDMYDTDNTRSVFSNRQEFLMEHELLRGAQSIVLVETEPVNTQQTMDILYAKYREEGYEGQMIRLDTAYVQGRTHNLLKRKEFQDAEYEILDILEGVGNRSGMMGKFILKAGDEEFESNALGGTEYYRELLANKDNYIGKMATVRFQNLTPRGVPRFPIVVAIRDYE